MRNEPFRPGRPTGIGKTIHSEKGETMLHSDQILATVEMIQKENLDVRTVTMGINLLDCRGGGIEETCARIENKIARMAGDFVPTCNLISRKLGIVICLGIPAIIGGGILYSFFNNYLPVVLYEILLLFCAGTIVFR